MEKQLKELEMMLETIGAPKALRDKCVKLTEKFIDFQDYLTEKEGITTEGLEKIYETYVQVEMNKKILSMEEEEAMELFGGNDAEFTKKMITELSTSFAKKYDYEDAEGFGKVAGDMLVLMEEINKSVGGSMFKAEK